MHRLLSTKTGAISMNNSAYTLLAVGERIAAQVVPAPLRSVMRRVLPRRPDARLESWNEPLVLGRPRPKWPLGRSGDAVGMTPVDFVERRVRCLLVSDSLDTGGVDEVVAFLARQLRAGGFIIAVLLASDTQPKGIGLIGRELIAEGFEIVDSGAVDGAAWMGSWHPDVVYIHGAVRWPLDVATRLGVPAAAALHGMHDLFPLTAAEVAEWSAKLVGVVAVSELVRREYLSKSPELDAKKAVVIPNGVDPSKIARIDPAAARRALGLKDEVLFVSLSRHCLQKNTYALVSAFEEVVATIPGAHLLIAGRVSETVYTRQVLALRDRSHVRDRIHLRGNVQRTDVLLGAADVFVLDSFFEGWALSSMEALASGVPVVLSDVGGAREQLATDVPSGILISNPIGEPVGLTWDAMLRARYQDQSNRAELVEALRIAGAKERPFAPRAEISAEAIARFNAVNAVSSHAEFLLGLAVSHRGPMR